MASVFVVRSRRPLLHYYSYPARRGYRRTAGKYGRIRWIKPTCTLRARGGKLEPSAHGVYARGVTVDVAQTAAKGRRGEGELLFFPRDRINQSGTISRPSTRPDAVRYECNNEDIVKKCLSAQPTFRARAHSVTAVAMRRQDDPPPPPSERVRALFPSMIAYAGINRTIVERIVDAHANANRVVCMQTTRERLVCPRA